MADPNFARVMQGDLPRESSPQGAMGSSPLSLDLGAILEDILSGFMRGMSGGMNAGGGGGGAPQTQAIGVQQAPARQGAGQQAQNPYANFYSASGPSGGMSWT